MLFCLYWGSWTVSIAVGVQFIQPILPPYCRTFLLQKMSHPTLVTLLVVASMLSCWCDAADKGRKDETCAHRCDTCMTVSDTLGHMRCIQRCKEFEDADSFTCSSIDGRLQWGLWLIYTKRDITWSLVVFLFIYSKKICHLWNYLWCKDFGNADSFTCTSINGI